MGQDITKNILSKKNMPYSTRKSLTPLKKSSVVKDPKIWTPNIQDVKKIIDSEIPKTMDDLVFRRIGVHSKEWKLYTLM